jgi:hypothetical protein
VLQLSGGLTLIEEHLRKNLTESFTYDEAGRKLTQTVSVPATHLSQLR